MLANSDLKTRLPLRRIFLLTFGIIRYLTFQKYSEIFICSVLEAWGNRVGVPRGHRVLHPLALEVTGNNVVLRVDHSDAVEDHVPHGRLLRAQDYTLTVP